MCLDHQEFGYCDLYCLLQTVETDPSLTQESQEAVKQQHIADTSELLDKMTRNQVRAMFLLEIWTQILSVVAHQDIFEGAMTALGLTACMMAWPTTACFNCVFLPTNVFISRIFKDSGKYAKHFSGVDISSAEGYISFLVSTAFISVCISFAAVSITLNFCSSESLV